jgi:hypothetical protein
MGRLPALGLSLAAADDALPVSFLAAYQVTVPTGNTSWKGTFTSTEADRGRLFFSGKCAECPGGNLQGAMARR